MDVGEEHQSGDSNTESYEGDDFRNLIRCVICHFFPTVQDYLWIREQELNDAGFVTTLVNGDIYLRCYNCHRYCPLLCFHPTVQTGSRRTLHLFA